MEGVEGYKSKFKGIIEDITKKCSNGQDMHGVKWITKNGTKKIP